MPSCGACTVLRWRSCIARPFRGVAPPAPQRRAVAIGAGVGQRRRVRSSASCAVYHGLRIPGYGPVALLGADVALAYLCPCCCALPPPPPRAVRRCRAPAGSRAQQTPSSLQTSMSCARAAPPSSARRPAVPAPAAAAARGKIANQHAVLALAALQKCQLAHAPRAARRWTTCHGPSSPLGAAGRRPAARLPGSPFPRPSKMQGTRRPAHVFPRGARGPRSTDPPCGLNPGAPSPPRRPHGARPRSARDEPRRRRAGACCCALAPFCCSCRPARGLAGAASTRINMRSRRSTTRAPSTRGATATAAAERRRRADHGARRALQAPHHVFHVRCGWQRVGEARRVRVGGVHDQIGRQREPLRAEGAGGGNGEAGVRCAVEVELVVVVAAHASAAT